MSIPFKKLKDITIIRTGKLDSNAAESDGKFPFFTCSPTTLRINSWAYDTEAVLLAGNNATGNYTAKYYKGKFNAYQRTYIIEANANNEINVKYLCYALNRQLRLLKNISSGATTKFLTIRLLNELDIPCPEIEIQNKIASYLSVYDDLIENNQRQISLLEESAIVNYLQVIESCDGTCILNEIGEFNRGKVITAKDACAGIVPVVAGGLESSYSHNVSNTESPVITVSASGANAGFVRLYTRPVWASDCSFLDCRKTDYLLFVYCFLKTSPDLMKNLQRGAAQPHVNAKQLNSLEVPQLSKEKLSLFERRVTPFFEKIAVCDKAIDSARNARELLMKKIFKDNNNEEIRR